MNHKNKVAILTGSLFLLLFVIYACASQQIAPGAAESQIQQVAAVQDTAPVMQVAAAQNAPAPPPAQPKSLYEMDIKPLTPAECGSCHYSVFSQIRDEGGKHQLECTKCHTKFHAYNPVKQNWKDIMPKCEECHGKFHGETFTVCMDCHSEPHAPKKQITVSADLNKACGDCHGKVNKELQANPSKHTQVACGMCHHQKHGYIPSCMECHKPHDPSQTEDKECLACHPVHSPLVIAYPQTVANEVCGGCHSAVYNKLTSSKSKHGQVACAACHTKHRYVPQCQECHGQPHGEVVLKKFPDCLACHVDVHDLPSGAK